MLNTKYIRNHALKTKSCVALQQEKRAALLQDGVKGGKIVVKVRKIMKKGLLWTFFFATIGQVFSQNRRYVHNPLTITRRTRGLSKQA